MNLKLKSAIILAAGYGTRLMPLSNFVPKPLIIINKTPLIFYQIQKLKKSRFDNLIINLHYQGEKIKKEIGDSRKWKMNISYSYEKVLLDTGGGIKKASKSIDTEIFVCVNSDIFLDGDYDFLDKGISKLNKEKNKEAILYLIENPYHNIEGDFSLNEDRVINKSKISFTFSGIAIYKKKFFLGLDENEPFPLIKILKKKIPQELILGQVLEKKWYDLGTIKRLNKFENFLNNKN